MNYTIVFDNENTYVSINGLEDGRDACAPCVIYKNPAVHDPMRRFRDDGYRAFKTNHFPYEDIARIALAFLGGKEYVTMLTCDYWVRGIQKWMDAIDELDDDVAPKAAAVLMRSHDDDWSWLVTAHTNVEWARTCAGFSGWATRIMSNSGATERQCNKFAAIQFILAQVCFGTPMLPRDNQNP